MWHRAKARFAPDGIVRTEKFPHLRVWIFQITEDEAADLAQGAARFASALREAIQVANATEVEIELDPALFE